MKTIKKYDSIQDAYVDGAITVGTMIRSDANGEDNNGGRMVAGMVGEIDDEDCKLWIWTNDKHCDGNCGNINPTEHGFKYAWEVDLENCDSQTEIEIYTPDPEPVELPKGLNNKESLTYLLNQKCKTTETETLSKTS